MSCGLGARDLGRVCVRLRLWRHRREEVLLPLRHPREVQGGSELSAEALPAWKEVLWFGRGPGEVSSLLCRPLNQAPLQCRRVPVAHSHADLLLRRRRASRMRVLWSPSCTGSVGLRCSQPTGHRGPPLAERSALLPLSLSLS